MKALPLLVWPRLKFFKSRSNFKIKVTSDTCGKVLSQGMYISNHLHNIKVLRLAPHHWTQSLDVVKMISNMKALPLLVRKLWPKLKFFKSRSNFKVKVHRSKILVLVERSCHKECTYQI